MKVDGKDMRPIWFDRESKTVQVIDQRFLPHELRIKDLNTVDDAIYAIKEMVVRGAPLIGATGAMGVYVSLVQEGAMPEDDGYVEAECARLKDARPTAMNLFWGVDRIKYLVLRHESARDRIKAALNGGLEVIEEEAVNCRKIGEYGSVVIEDIYSRKKGAPVNILTHCNAGWLACIEYGTATAPHLYGL